MCFLISFFWLVNKPSISPIWRTCNYFIKWSIFETPSIRDQSTGKEETKIFFRNIFFQQSSLKKTSEKELWIMVNHRWTRNNTLTILRNCKLLTFLLWDFGFRFFFLLVNNNYWGISFWICLLEKFNWWFARYFLILADRGVRFGSVFGQ